MELVQLLLLVLSAIAYSQSRVCNTEKDELLVNKDGNEGDVISYADVDDTINSLSLSNDYKNEEGDNTRILKDLVPADSFYEQGLAMVRSEGNDLARRSKTNDKSVTVNTVKKQDKKEYKKTKKSAPSEQGIWAWRGKKEVGDNEKAKRRNYFTRKMINWMNFNKANLARKQGNPLVIKTRYGKRNAYQNKRNTDNVQLLTLNRHGMGDEENLNGELIA